MEGVPPKIGREKDLKFPEKASLKYLEQLERPKVERKVSEEAIRGEVPSDLGLEVEEEEELAQEKDYIDGTLDSGEVLEMVEEWKERRKIKKKRVKFHKGMNLSNTSKEF